MTATTLQEKLTAAGARMGSYRGGETPATFGDAATEFDALLHGAAVFDLGWQAKLLIGGKDRTRWLNGMITNNIRDLAEGRGVYAFKLTPQGRNEGDLTAYNRGEHLMATTDREQLAKLQPLLQRYIIMDKVELEDISDKLSSIGIAGPKAAEMLAKAGIDAAQLEPGQVIDVDWQDVGISIVRNAHPRMDGYEVWLAPENNEKLWDALVDAGATPVGSDALEMYRIARGVPRYGMDLRERDLPQETGQEHALNFSKGCYIGQEIVERIRARGNVHRTLIGFEVQGEPPQPTTKIHANDKDVGEVTSSTRLPNGHSIAIGYLRKEVAEPGTVVQIGEHSATVKTLPFQF
jgi:folate-binding protein YgfZ